MSGAKVKPSRKRWLTAIVVGLLVLPAIGCARAHVFTGEVPVQGTSQRLVVGSEQGFCTIKKKAWVIQDGKLEKVKIVKEVSR